MDGINFASLHFVHSSFRAMFGNESANALVRSTCESTILFKAEGAIACCQCLQSMQTTKGFLQPTTSISHLRAAFLNRTLFDTAYPLFFNAKAVISSNSCQQSKLLMCSTSAPKDAALTASLSLPLFSTSTLSLF